MERIRVRT